MTWPLVNCIVSYATVNAMFMNATSIC